MKITYSPDVDIAYIKLAQGKYKVSHEKRGGVVVDFSKEGKILGFEILDASKTAPEIVKQFGNSKKLASLPISFKMNM